MRRLSPYPGTDKATFVELNRVGWSGGGLGDPDQVAFGVGELAEGRAAAGHRVRAVEPTAAELLGLPQRRLDVVDLGVERDVPVAVAAHLRRQRHDAAADADAVGGEVVVAGDHAV